MAENKFTPYGIAILLVLAVAVFRLTFGLVLAPGAYYYLYYPAVVVAYLYGMRPAMTNDERGLLRLTFPTELRPLPQWDFPLTLN